MRTVNIVAMGETRNDFLLAHFGTDPSCNAVAGEVWAINHMGALLRADRVIAMDDPDLWTGQYNTMALEKLRRSSAPIYTTRHCQLFPATVAYPLGEVVRDLRIAYFSNTVAYAIALAIHEKVDVIQLWGCDFSYENSAAYEPGRACVEFWISQAMARGIRVQFSPNTRLLNTNGAKFYGYLDQPDIQTLMTEPSQ